MYFVTLIITLIRNQLQIRTEPILKKETSTFDQIE